jgi:cytochrome c1
VGANSGKRLRHAAHSRPLLSILFVVSSSALIGGCSDPALHPHAEGDADRGKRLLQQYGCIACHKIPGVRNATGVIGPPLDRLGRRVYIAGTLVNSPSELANWIREPERLKPGTGMPNAHVTEPDARDMVAYLYRLR